MSMFIVILLAVFFDPPTKADAPSETKVDATAKDQSDPKKAIKALLVEADKRYRESIKEFQRAKTSADKTEVLERHLELFQDWLQSQDDLSVEFESRVTDVQKDQFGSYRAILTMPRLLEPFQASYEKPVVAGKVVSLEIDDAQRSEMEPGTLVRVSGTLEIGMAIEQDRYRGQGFLSFRSDKKAMAGGADSSKTMVVPFNLEDVKVEVVEKPKKPTGKKSK